jgi:polygalacturonase
MALTKVSYSMITGAPANVLDYGADPTGVADSQPAIQAAINSGAKEVIIPSGTYRLNSGLVINKSDAVRKISVQYI